MYNINYKNIKANYGFFAIFLAMGMLFFIIFGYFTFGGVIKKIGKEGITECTNVEIETIYGDFTIARQKLSKYNLLPHYMMNMDREYNVNIIYYYGVETNLPELNNKRELVAEWNKIKIWVIKNS